MLYSIKGKISGIEKKLVIISTTDFDYEVFVSRPTTFLVGEFIYLYLYHVIKEDDEYLVGFRTQEEKKVFKLLLNVQGIGPKSALGILSNVMPNDLLIAISNNDYDFIKAIPGVTSHSAQQIMLDLRQYIAKSNKENNTLYKEVREALRILNFKASEIDKVLPNIFIPNATKDVLIKEALRRMKTNV